jgi:hypothetical protein
MNKIKIKSTHATLAEAVEEAKVDLSYNPAEAPTNQALTKTAARNFITSTPLTSEWTVTHQEATGLLMLRASWVCIVAHYGDTVEAWEIVTTGATFTGDRTVDALEQAARNLAEVRSLLISLHASCCA